MLDVTRQSVSKWESGTTYPEMDKLITMCKIFKCSLDDLTNDEVSEINVEKKQQSGGVISNLVSNVIDIIDKTVKMFRTMNAKQVVGMLVTLFILAMCLCILRIPFECLENGFYNIIMNIPNRGVVGALSGLFNMILDIAFFSLYILAFMYIYKVAYLDKYSFVTKEGESTDSEKVIEEEKETIAHETKEVKIVTSSNPKDNTLFCFLGNIILWFLRILTAFCTIPFIIILVVLFAMGVVAVTLMFEGIIYIGVILGILFAIILTLWVLELGCVFIFNKKSSFHRLLWTFFVGLSGIGISLGLITMEITGSTFVDEPPVEYELKTDTEEFPMRDDLAIDGTSYYYKSIDYIVDETLTDNVVVSAEYYGEMRTSVVKQDENLLNINLYSLRTFGVDKKLWDSIKKDLASRTFHNYDELFGASITIKSSEANIAKIKANSKEYLDNQVRLEYQDYYYQLEVKVSDYQSELEELRERNEELEEQVSELEAYKERVKDLVK